MRSAGSSNRRAASARVSTDSMPGSAAIRAAPRLRSRAGDVDEREGAERPVVHDIRIGDRQYHPRAALCRTTASSVSCR